MDINKEIRPALEAARQAKAAIEAVGQLLEIGSKGGEILGNWGMEPYTAERYAAEVICSLPDQCSLNDCISELEEFVNMNFRAKVLSEIAEEEQATAEEAALQAKTRDLVERIRALENAEHENNEELALLREELCSFTDDPVPPHGRLTRQRGWHAKQFGLTAEELEAARGRPA